MVIICVHSFFLRFEICAIFGGKKYDIVVVPVFLVYLPLF
jgi:hypothetical protein